MGVSHSPPTAGSTPRASLTSHRRSLPSRLLGTDWAIGYLFLVPMLVVLLGFVAYPFFSAIWLSLNAKVLGGEAHFIGLGNFQRLLEDKRFLQAALNTAIYTVFGVGLKAIVGMTAALVLNEGLRPRNLWRMLFFLPWSIPIVIGAYTWRWIYDDLSGVLSQTLIQMGLADQYILWLADANLTLKSILAVVLWQGTPFYIMSFLAGLSAIPQELYEAAEVDGAGTLSKFVNITLPGLLPVIIIVCLLSTIWTSNDMQFVYVLTRGGPNGVSEIFPHLAYHTAMVTKNLGQGAAIPLFSLPFLLVIIYFLTGRMLERD